MDYSSHVNSVTVLNFDREEVTYPFRLSLIHLTGLSVDQYRLVLLLRSSFGGLGAYIGDVTNTPVRPHVSAVRGPTRYGRKKKGLRIH